MSDIDRYRPDDRRSVETLYRRVFGADASSAWQLRWDWQFRRNPYADRDHAPIWVTREGPTVVGALASLPVRASLKGLEVVGGWALDAMVAPERQHQGIGEQLFRTWERSVGAALGLGLTPNARKLLHRLGWADPLAVPCLVKPLTRRAIRQPNWPRAINRLVSALTLPVVRFVARSRPIRQEVQSIRRFDASATALWERVAPKLDLSVRRDATYLNWRYAEPPHIRYNIVSLTHDGATQAWAVYRHVYEPRSRVTLLVDFLADPDDESSLLTLLRWVDREAREADSDKVRAYVTHAAYRRTLRRSGYFQVKSDLEFAARISAVQVPPKFHEETDCWHITLGDADQDPVLRASPALLEA